MPARSTLSTSEASTGNDHVTVIGTDLDDTASVVGDAGHLHSSAYSVNTYSSENTTFVSGGGNDYSQLYGSLSDDHLAGSANGCHAHDAIARNQDARLRSS